MKTIVIAHDYSKNSFASMSYFLSHYLAEKGFKVIFISHKPYFPQKKQEVIKNGELIICSWTTKKRPTGFRDLLFFIKIYLKYRPNYVIGHFVGSNITVLVSKVLSFFKTKTFVYYHTLSTQQKIDSNHNSRLQFFFKIRKKIFYSIFVDLLICPSKMAKDDVSSFFNFKDNKSIVILNPLPDRFTEKEIKAKENQYLNISFLGRLDNSKNIILLIHTFILFIRRNKEKNIKLNIAGAGAETKKIKELIDEYNEIEFFGQLNYKEVDNYIKNSDFIIIPSKYDNLPTVGLESLMIGTPLLISYKTGLSHYLSDGFDCLKFIPTEEGIYNILNKICDPKFKKQINNMSFNSRKTYLKLFSMKNYCNTIYKELLNGK